MPKGDDIDRADWLTEKEKAFLRRQRATETDIDDGGPKREPPPPDPPRMSRAMRRAIDGDSDDGLTPRERAFLARRRR